MSDYSMDAYYARMAVSDACSYIAGCLTRPSVLYRPKLYRDGDQWGVLLGDNVQSGFVAYGDSPQAAFNAFDEKFCSPNNNAMRSSTVCGLARVMLVCAVKAGALALFGLVAINWMTGCESWDQERWTERSYCVGPYDLLTGGR